MNEVFVCSGASHLAYAGILVQCSLTLSSFRHWDILFLYIYSSSLIFLLCVLILWLLASCCQWWTFWNSNPIPVRIEQRIVKFFFDNSNRKKVLLTVDRGWKAKSNFLHTVFRWSRVSHACLSPPTHTAYVVWCGVVWTWRVYFSVRVIVFRLESLLYKAMMTFRLSLFNFSVR